jgi:tetratricopeptide (TPR) repeat protein
MAGPSNWIMISAMLVALGIAPALAEKRLTLISDHVSAKSLGLSPTVPEILDEALNATWLIKSNYSRAAALEGIATVQIKVGNLTGAKETIQAAVAAAHSPMRQNSRIFMLTQIAVVQAKSGNKLGARKTFEEAISRVDSVIEYEREPSLLTIIEGMADAGEYVLALSTAQSSNLPEAFAYIAKVKAVEGDKVAALIIARGIEDAHQRGVALADIAETLATAGDMESAGKLFAEALSTAREVEAVNRGYTLSYIATSLAKVDDIAAAFLVARSIKSAQSRETALSYVAGAQARAGDIKAALATAAGIKSEFWHDAALRNCGVEQAKAGDFSGAFVTAKNISKRWGMGTQVLTAISLAHAVAGDFDLAFSTVQELRSKGEALASIAAEQAKDGEILEATTTIRKIPKVTVLIRAFNEVALILASRPKAVPHNSK